MNAINQNVSATYSPSSAENDRIQVKLSNHMMEIVYSKMKLSLQHDGNTALHQHSNMNDVYSHHNTTCLHTCTYVRTYVHTHVQYISNVPFGTMPLKQWLAPHCVWGVTHDSPAVSLQHVPQVHSMHRYTRLFVVLAQTEKAKVR